jgi:hypothetical protein
MTDDDCCGGGCGHSGVRAVARMGELESARECYVFVSFTS